MNIRQPISIKIPWEMGIKNQIITRLKTIHRNIIRKPHRCNGCYSLKFTYRTDSVLVECAQGYHEGYMMEKEPCDDYDPSIPLSPSAVAGEGGAECAKVFSDDDLGYASEFHNQPMMVQDDEYVVGGAMMHLGSKCERCGKELPLWVGGYLMIPMEGRAHLLCTECNESTKGEQDDKTKQSNK